MVFNPPQKEVKEPNYLRYSRGGNKPAALREQGEAPVTIQPQGARLEVTPYKGAVYEGDKHVNQAGYYSGLSEGYRLKGEVEAQGFALKAEGTALAGLGETLESSVKVANLAAKGAETVIQKSLDSSINQAYDRNYDPFDTALQKVAGGMKLIDPDKDTRQKPEDVAKVEQYAQTLKNSYDAVHISRT